jgi:hypothetical protein
MIPLGAINKKTREYVYPKIANKKDKYCCPECDKDLILHQGNIRIHHFVHKFTESEPCNYYNFPTESQIHRAAKLLLKTLLDKKEKISFIRKCCHCKKDEEFEIPETTETSNIELEYRFEYDGLKIADVAYIENGEIFCIFEICHTHKTKSENRPEPWFEIDALSLIQNINNTNNSSIKINCIRCEKCEECIQLEKDKIEKKERAIDILYNWFKSGIEIPPFMYWNNTFAGVEKNAKCEFMDDVFDLIIEYGECSISRPLYSTAFSYHGEEKYQRYCIRLVNNSNYYFSKEKEIVIAGLGVYYLDVDWVLSQENIPKRINYIASLDFYDQSSFEKFNTCIKCNRETPFYVKRINILKSDYKVITTGCLECDYNKNSEYINCPICNSRNTPLCVMETNIYNNICKSCDVDLYSSGKIYLSVSFKEKDEAKKLGANWDNQYKRWFIHKNHLNVVLVLQKYKQKW